MMTKSLRCLNRSGGESNTGISGLLRKGQNPAPGRKHAPGALLRSELGEKLVKQKRHMGTMNLRKKAKFRLQQGRLARRKRVRCTVLGDQSRLMNS